MGAADGKALRQYADVAWLDCYNDSLASGTSLSILLLSLEHRYSLNKHYFTSMQESERRHVNDNAIYVAFSAHRCAISHQIYFMKKAEISALGRLDDR